MPSILSIIFDLSLFTYSRFCICNTSVLNYNIMKHQSSSSLSSYKISLNRLRTTHIINNWNDLHQKLLIKTDKKKLFRRCNDLWSQTKPSKSLRSRSYQSRLSIDTMKMKASIESQSNYIFLFWWLLFCNSSENRQTRLLFDRSIFFFDWFGLSTVRWQYKRNRIWWLNTDQEISSYIKKRDKIDR